MFNLLQLCNTTLCTVQVDTSIRIDKIEKLDSKGAVENSSKSLIEQARVVVVTTMCASRVSGRDVVCLQNVLISYDLLSTIYSLSRLLGASKRHSTIV